jgi:sugar O-acyltransferase (sialic acid O-acetyltransferase NeuD family)
MDSVIMIGYSGHGYVAADIMRASGLSIIGYCDAAVKDKNPFGLKYLGRENELTPEQLSVCSFFVAIGDNRIRRKVYDFIQSLGGQFTNAIHPQAILASTVSLKEMVMIAAGACINPLVELGSGVICNTSCSIDHECIVGDFSHIGPGAVLCGNVEVGESSFIGAGSVIRQGIKIGNNCMIGAGAVIVKDVPDGALVIGNPGSVKE